MSKDPKPCPEILRVVLRNDAPLINAEGSPSRRSVAIRLTGDQRAALARQWAGRHPGGDYYEDYDSIFFEEAPDAR